jgi:hypothetical protein
MVVIKTWHVMLIMASMICASIPMIGAAQEITLPVNGELSVTSTPPGAIIYVNGELVKYQTTPASGEVPVGVYNVRIVLSGYEPYETVTEVRTGVTSYVHANLIPIPSVGSIDVSSSPPHALVYVDNVYQGTTPQRVDGLTAGYHTVRVEKEGYKSWSESVQVEAARVTTVYATLTPDITFGSISVKTTPSSAYIYLDGEYVGTSSKTLSGLAPGSYHLELTKSGYYDWSSYVQVFTNKVTYIDVALNKIPSPTTGAIEVKSSPSGAYIYLDGAYEGKTAPDGYIISGVAPGSHVVSLRLTGYRDSSTSVTVNSGQTSYVSSVLVPEEAETGSIEVASSPSGASVLLNNQLKGVTPLTLEALAPGTYTVKLLLDGYQEWTAEATVTAGATTSLTATLAPVPATTVPSGSLPLPALGAFLLLGIALALGSLKKE